MVAIDNLLNSISETVAKAINQEDFTTLGEDIADILADSGLPAEEGKAALERAWITCWMASSMRSLPEATDVFPMNADPETIREDILSWLEDMPDYEDDPEAWEEMRKNVEELNLEGDSLSIPEGMVLEVFRSSCADALKENECWPEI